MTLVTRRTHLFAVGLSLLLLLGPSPTGGASLGALLGRAVGTVGTVYVMVIVIQQSIRGLAALGRRVTRTADDGLTGDSGS